ncbi:MAG: TetR/AcrR family transcriptional regulator, partial [Thermodesulfobacteriota bacterium]
MVKTEKRLGKPQEEEPEKADGRGAATREMILAAAREVFSRHPYHAASIRMIAAQGSFYHGLIRYHFPSKAAIFEAVVEEICSELLKQNREWLMEAAGLSPDQALSLYLDRFIAYHRSRPETFRIVVKNLSQEDGEEIPGYHHLRDLLSGSRADFTRLFAGLFTESSLTCFLESFNTLIIHYL